MTLDDLRLAALDIFNELSEAGIKAERRESGKGLPHAMWLAYMIGKKITEVDRANRYLGNIQTILVYERFWDHQHMMDRAAEWYRGEFRTRVRQHREQVRRPLNPGPYGDPASNFDFSKLRRPPQRTL